MLRINLSKEGKDELKQRLSGEPRSKLYRRLQFLDLEVNQGKSRAEISVLLGVSVNTLTNWAKLFQQGGFSKLCSLNYEGRRVSRLAPLQGAIEKHLEENIVNTLGELQAWLFQEHEISISRTGLWIFLKKVGIQLQGTMA